MSRHQIRAPRGWIAEIELLIRSIEASESSLGLIGDDDSVLKRGRQPTAKVGVNWLWLLFILEDVRSQACISDEQ